MANEAVDTTKQLSVKDCGGECTCGAKRVAATGAGVSLRRSLSRWSRTEVLAVPLRKRRTNSPG